MVPFFDVLIRQNLVWKNWCGVQQGGEPLGTVNLQENDVVSEILFF